MRSGFSDTERAWRELPGLVRELVASKLIDPALPALRVLRDELPRDWWVFSSRSGILHQLGWPLRNDVALAVPSTREAYGARKLTQLY